MRPTHRIILIISLLIGASLYSFNTQYKNIVYGDAFGYYTYLPSLFIHHDIKEPIELNKNEVISLSRENIREYLGGQVKSPKGYLLNQYTYGVALFEAPFFFIAHVYELSIGKEATGFSKSYKTMIRISTLFYSLLGLYILFLCVSRYFSPTSSLLSLCTLVLGTHFLWFIVIQAGMAHNILFFLISSLLFVTIKLHEKPKLSYFILLGFIIGFIALIRPTEIIFVSIPILFNIYNWTTLVEKFKFIYHHKYKILLAIVLAALTFVPQLIYWKELTGKYFFYSYGEQRFHWRHPHIWDGLFSYKNGFFVYAPVMILAFIGLVFARKLKSFYLIIFCTIPVFIYLAYAWYCYNYINGLGSRPTIHLFPLLAFPLAALYEYIGKSKWYIKIPFAFIVVFSSSISYSYCIQQAKGTLWSENSTKTFNLHTLYRYKLDYDDLVCNDNEVIQPKQASVDLIKVLDSTDFETSTLPDIITDSIKKSRVYNLNNGREYPDIILQFPYSKKEFKNAQWIKCSGQFFMKEYCDRYNNHMMVLEVKRGDSIVYWKSCSVNNKIGLCNQNTPKEGYTLFELRLNQWGEVYFFADIPDYLKDGDNVRMLIWDMKKKDLLFDDLKLEIYKNRIVL